MELQNKIEQVMIDTGCDKLTAILSLMQTLYQVADACIIIKIRAA